jgi:hypothetical protein
MALMHWPKYRRGDIKVGSHLKAGHDQECAIMLHITVTIHMAFGVTNVANERAWGGRGCWDR